MLFYIYFEQDYPKMAEDDLVELEVLGLSGFRHNLKE